MNEGDWLKQTQKAIITVISRLRLSISTLWLKYRLPLQDLVVTPVIGLAYLFYLYFFGKRRLQIATKTAMPDVKISLTNLLLHQAAKIAF